MLSALFTPKKKYQLYVRWTKGINEYGGWVESSSDLCLFTNEEQIALENGRIVQNGKFEFVLSEKNICGKSPLS